MFLNDVPNNADISAIIIAELRNNFNIKYRKEKKQKCPPISGTQRIFHKPLSSLDFTEVTLATGNVCEVPRFVVDAIHRILEDVGVEGLFRKAGSTARQKEIRDKLEKGHPFDRTHNTIDVANILKYFFRELPDALLPIGNFQETILRCLLCKGSNERRINAIKMVCLLLPQRHLNTLVYFMQFLNAVSQHSQQNKMSIKNLAIIFAPGLMPISENVGQRLISHVQIIEILIEHANDLGMVPSAILGKVQNIVLADSHHHAVGSINNGTAADSMSGGNGDAPWTESKKKKKRRSGSLTRMFNGLRKIVGAIGGSAEDLDTTPDIQNSLPPTTPCLTKSNKKRKVLDASAFSNRKKKDVLELMPSGALLPTTPMCIKPAKKSRLSLGGKRYPKQVAIPVVPSISTRQSLDRQRTPHETWNNDNDHHSQPDSSSFDVISSVEPLAKKRLIDELPITKSYEHKGNEAPNESFMKISKSEYEEIKHRVSAIETRISAEFGKLQSSMINDTIDSVDMGETQHMNGPEKVLDKYERALEETDIINSSPSTEQLANRLSRGLKIRRSAEQKVFRSPSQRKIGNIRRRSQENVRLSRNKSWHLGNNCIPACVPAARAAVKLGKNVLNSDEYFASANGVSTCGATSATATVASSTSRMPAPNSFYPSKITSKRNQSKAITSTVTSQAYTSPTVVAPLPLDDKTNNVPVANYNNGPGVDSVVGATTTPKRGMDLQLQNEKWVCADIFFDDSSFQSPSTVTRRKRVRDRRTSDAESENNTPNMTPRSANSVTISESIKTPMLPPRLTSVKKANVTQSASRTPYPRPTISKTHLTPLMQQDYHMQHGGRASIARLRSQNAGMVLAKAKLFDELGTDLRNNGSAKVTGARRDENQMQSNANGALRRNAAIVEHHQSGQTSRKVTPRKQNGPNSPSNIQRRPNLRHMNYTPIKKSPLAMNTAMLSISEMSSDMQVDSPNVVDTTPHIKRPLTTKNPRRLVRTPQGKRKVASPLRATTPFKYRNSPRLHAIK